MNSGQKEKKSPAAAGIGLGERARSAGREFRRILHGELPEGEQGERLKNLAAALVACLFSTAKPLFSVCPFGISLVSAAETRLTYIFAGSLAGSILSGENPLPYAIACTSVFLLRRLLFAKEGSRRPKLRGTAYRLSLPKALVSKTAVCRDKIPQRTSYAALAALLVGVFRIVSGGFVFYDLFAAVFAVLACPLFTLLYAGFLSDGQKNRALFEAGAAAFLFTAVILLRPLEFFSVSAALVFATVATMLSAKSGGGLRALLLGLLLGLGIGPLYCPMLGIVGLLSSVLFRYSPVAALSASPMAGAVFAVCAGSFREGIGALPGLVISSVLAFPMMKHGIFRKILGLLPESRQEKEPPTEAPDSRDGGRIAALSRAFSELSDTFRELSSQAKVPVYEDYYALCETACRRECMNCGMKSICADRGDGREKLLSGITDQLYARGRATGAALPENGYRCYRLEKIVSSANAATARLLSASGKPSRTDTFAFDYGTVARTLDLALSEEKRDGNFSPVLSARLRKALEGSEFSAEQLGVYGVRRHTVKASGICLPQTKIKAERLRTIAEGALGEALTEPDFEIFGRRVSLTMHSRPTLRVQSVTRGLKRRGSEITGDSTRVMTTSDDYAVAMILDGMGSGRTAALTSRMGLLILTKMFESGNGRASALGMLTAFLLGGEEDRSTTLDLCEIDLITGQAVFLKCGAAPSFVLRRGKIYQLDCRTYPLGIAEGNGGRELAFSLLPGDRVILTSDGVPSSFEDKPALLSLLEESAADSPGDTAEKILRFSAEKTGGRDDITVTLLSLEGI